MNKDHVAEGVPLRVETSSDRWLPFERVARAVGTIAAIGSLIWKPIPGTRLIAPIAIDGFRKDFNTRVLRCRGTSEVPGLVFGLEPDRSTTAHGMLLAVESEATEAVWATFLLRELDDADYVPTIVAARRLDTNEPVQAVAVLVDTRSPSYFPHPPAALAAIIRRAVGTCGTNVEYAARCLSADRAIHGHLPNHLSELEKSLGVDPLSSSDKSVCREISRKGKKCSGFCFAS